MSLAAFSPFEFGGSRTRMIHCSIEIGHDRSLYPFWSSNLVTVVSRPVVITQSGLLTTDFIVADLPTCDVAVVKQFQYHSVHDYR